MSNSTATVPGGVVLDWRHAPVGPPAECVFGDGITICRSPVKGTPCHKACAEAWIAAHARDEREWARLVRAYTPRPRRGGAR
jgi:hypothetical protein